MFAIRLKELREQAGFSQAVLARKLGVRQSTVGMWENGKNKPQNSKLEMMASIFNVSTDYLLGRSDEPNTDNAEDKYSLCFYAGFAVAICATDTTCFHNMLHT